MTFVDQTLDVHEQVQSLKGFTLKDIFVFLLKSWLTFNISLSSSIEQPSIDKMRSPILSRPARDLLVEVSCILEIKIPIRNGGDW